MISQKTQQLLKSLRDAVGISYTDPSQKLTSPRRIEAIESQVRDLVGVVDELRAELDRKADKRGPKPKEAA